MKKNRIVLIVLAFICLFICVGSISAKLVNDPVISYTKVSCGNVTGIPKKIPRITSDIVKILQVAVPVILVLFGSLDLAKGVMAGKEDEIKKGQGIFIKRLITGAIVFFVVVVVKFLVSVISDSNAGYIVDCIDCFISNDCDVQDTPNQKQ